MDGKATLTVVVLTYNSGATIGECLVSLAEQEYPDFDVIIVDDGSEDDTLSVVWRYSERLRLSVIENGSRNIRETVEKQINK